MYLPGSGLTRVLTALAASLEGGDVRVLGFVPCGSATEAGTIGGREAMLVPSPGRCFSAPQPWLANCLAEQRPRHILVTGPPFMTAAFLRQLQGVRATTTIALYMPIEGRLIGDSLAEVAGLADLCLLYTSGACADMEALCGRLAARDPNFHAPRLAVAGHGFDKNLFYPLPAPNERERRRRAKRAFFGDRPDLADATIVLNANRVDSRKRLDLTLEGFALFAKAQPKARLCLHTGPRPFGLDDTIRRLISAAGLGDRVLLSPERSDELLSDARMNLLYNACEIGLSTSMGEGWGLAAFEHAATRAALVLPAHTSFLENWAHAAELVEASGSYFSLHDSSTMYPVAPAGVAAALAALCDDPRRYAALADAAFARVARSDCDWRSVARSIQRALTFTGTSAEWTIPPEARPAEPVTPLR